MFYSGCDGTVLALNKMEGTMEGSEYPYSIELLSGKEEIMFCHNCGSQIAKDAIFCQKCGTKVFYEDVNQEISDSLKTGRESQNASKKDQTSSKEFSGYSQNSDIDQLNNSGIQQADKTITNEKTLSKTQDSSLKKKKKRKHVPELICIALVGMVVDAILTSETEKPSSSSAQSSEIYADEIESNEIVEENKLIVEPEKASSVSLMDESSENTDVEYIGNIYLEELTDFSEGKAFIQYIDISEDDRNNAFEAAIGDEEDRVDYAMQHWDDYAEGSNRVALIDTKGEILWKSEVTRNDTALTEVSSFKDGLACFIFNGNEEKSYNIIDANGNITYTKKFSEDFIILGGGDGLFLTAEHISNFDTDEWQIGTIDKNGNIVAAYKAYEIGTPPSKPSHVENPPEYPSELEEISNALDQLEIEYQAWIEECQEYQGDIDAQYYQMIGDTEVEYQNKRTELMKEQQQLEEEYYGQLENYESYQRELDEYEEKMEYYTPKKISFGRDSGDLGSYQSCEYLGENIYKVNFEYGFVVLNMETLNIISLCNRFEGMGYIERFITDFENGTATVLYNDPVDWETNAAEAVAVQMLPQSLYSICRMEVDGSLTPTVSNIWTKYVLPDIMGNERIFYDGLLFVPYDRGSDMDVRIDKEYYAMTGDRDSAYENGFIFQTGVYYDMEGEVAIDFPEYRGKYDYVCGSFYDGHALMIIEGADQLMYFTVINKDADFIFEPLSGFEDAYMSKDGKFIVAIKSGSLTVFDIKGNPLTSIDYGNIVPDTEHNTTVYNMCDGMLRFNGIKGFYINIEDGTVIGSTFIDAKDLIITKHDS